MAKDRRIPAWLARRTYFKRIERWSKPGKPRPALPTHETEVLALPSNVVPFPVRLDRPDRPDLPDRRSVSMA
ncbi:hypothetical protein MKK69_11525 [Methylobacterium sp. J-026]|uniref:hypothetical protein n=1 Tax=Methylobacterium sp. J-026 TaxID=2836624 RepID=UPI001FB8C31F|nr:hypothetical protein [Methylobacterium sp. J-026]MCJ2134680.1 hypothetical protein [Methylobacterium sp. J-026]